MKYSHSKGKLKLFHKYFRNLYSSSNPQETEMSDFWNSISISKLNEEHFVQSDIPISVKKTKDAIDLLPRIRWSYCRVLEEILK